MGATRRFKLAIIGFEIDTSSTGIGYDGQDLFTATTLLPFIADILEWDRIVAEQAVKSAFLCLSPRGN